MSQVSDDSYQAADRLFWSARRLIEQPLGHVVWNTDSEKISALMLHMVHERIVYSEMMQALQKMNWANWQTDWDLHADIQRNRRAIRARGPLGMD